MSFRPSSRGTLDFFQYGAGFALGICLLVEKNGGYFGLVTGSVLVLLCGTGLVAMISRRLR